MYFLGIGWLYLRRFESACLHFCSLELPPAACGPKPGPRTFFQAVPLQRRIDQSPAQTPRIVPPGASPGVVTDPTVGIAQAQLTVTCGSYRNTVASDAAGAYSLTVPSGHYQLLVEAPNFSSLSQEVSVSDGLSGTVLNPVLQLGSLRASSP